MASNEPKCLSCGHQFTAIEIAAMGAFDQQDDLCMIDCSSCECHNIVRVEPQSGFEEQPKLVVLRTSEKGADVDKVFEETVEPGTHVHPVTRGESQ